jgi:hypothetical protein
MKSSQKHFSQNKYRYLVRFPVANAFGHLLLGRQPSPPMREQTGK